MPSAFFYEASRLEKRCLDGYEHLPILFIGLEIRVKLETSIDPRCHSNERFDTRRRPHPRRDHHAIRHVNRPDLTAAHEREASAGNTSAKT